MKDIDRHDAAEAFLKLLDLISTLRNPQGGCPWDLEQTHESLKPYVVEETYEVIEAINAKDDQEFVKELGDLLLQVVLHAQLARERNAFSITDVLNCISKKLVHRHPHVFSQTKVSGTEEVLQNWEQIKLRERSPALSTKGSPVLAGIPKSLPALLRAQRVGEKAARVHFDWQSGSGVWSKVKEEIAELEKELGESSRVQAKLEHELGDILFALCQLARWLKLSAEEALQAACRRFHLRFSRMEQLSGAPDALKSLSDEALDKLWEQAKMDLQAEEK